MNWAVKAPEWSRPFANIAELLSVGWQAHSAGSWRRDRSPLTGQELSSQYTWPCTRERMESIKPETILTSKEAGYSSIKAYGELVNFGSLGGRMGCNIIRFVILSLLQYKRITGAENVLVVGTHHSCKAAFDAAASPGAASCKWLVRS